MQFTPLYDIIIGDGYGYLINSHSVSSKGVCPWGKHLGYALLPAQKCAPALARIVAESWVSWRSYGFFGEIRRSRNNRGGSTSQGVASLREDQPHPAAHKVTATRDRDIDIRIIIPLFRFRVRMTITSHKVAAARIGNIKYSCCYPVYPLQQIAARLPFRGLRIKGQVSSCPQTFRSIRSQCCRYADDREWIS